MSLFDDLLNRVLSALLSKVENLLKPVLGPFKGLVGIISKFWDKTTNILTTLGTIFNEAHTEFEAIKNFKFETNINTRVILVSAAVDTIRRLSDVPGQLVSAFKDLIQQLKDTLHQDSATDLEEGVFEDVEGASDLEEFVAKFGGRFSEIGGKILGWATIIITALTQIEAVLDDVKTILDAIKEVRQDFENFDGFFLPQTNGRIKVKLVQENGNETFANLRDGALHASLDTSED